MSKPPIHRDAKREGGESKANFERARLSQTEAESRDSGRTEKYRDKDEENKATIERTPLIHEAKATLRCRT